MEMGRQGDAGDLVYPVCLSLTRRRDGRKPLRETACPPLRLFLYPFTQPVDERDWFDGIVGLKEENLSMADARSMPPFACQQESHAIWKPLTNTQAYRSA